MKTFKTLLAVGFFIAMYFYVQSEEKKAKINLQHHPYLISKNDSTRLNVKKSNTNYFDRSLSIKR